MLYRVDLSTYDVDPILIDSPLSGFLDGLAMRDGVVYIMYPCFWARRAGNGPGSDIG